tara:strand:- start:2807 stop:3136 length:330 start_codon:yes stop_codon:yes gene_type:complete
MTVEVTQEDREAYLAMNMLPEFDAADVRAGLWDKVTGLQAFARHRIEATRAAAERIAELEGALEPFAKYRGSDEYLRSASDDGLCQAASFTAGDYRRARAALQHKEPKP